MCGRGIILTFGTKPWKYFSLRKTFNAHFVNLCVCIPAIHEDMSTVKPTWYDVSASVAIVPMNKPILCKQAGKTIYFIWERHILKKVTLVSYFHALSDSSRHFQWFIRDFPDIVIQAKYASK